MTIKVLFVDDHEMVRIEFQVIYQRKVILK